MNKNKGDKIIESVKNIKMKAGEKDRVRSFLLDEIDKSEQFRETKEEKAVYQGSLLWQSWGLFSFGRTAKFAAAFFLIVALGGGTVLASENSLPGDRLYPVKVNVSEPVAGVFYFGEETRAEREVALVEKRIKEMHQIVSRDRGVRAQVEAEAQLEKHLEKLDRRLARLETQGKLDSAVEISSRMEASLGASADSLLAFGSASQISVEMENTLRTKQQEASRSRAGIEERVSTSVNIEASARRAYNSALSRQAETETFISRLGRGTEGLALNARDRLEVAGGLIEEGESYMKAGEYMEAYRLFNEAIRISQGTKFALENRIESDDRSLAVNRVSPEDEGRDSLKPSEISSRPVTSGQEKDGLTLSLNDRETGMPASPGPLPTVAPLNYSKVGYSIESGLHNNLTEEEDVLVFSETLEITDTGWLRVEFADYNLGSASFITITSDKDGASQTLNSETIRDWQGISAFFNGNRLKLELFVAPGDEGIFFEVEEIWVEGRHDNQNGQSSNGGSGTEDEVKPDLNLETGVGSQSELQLNF